MQICTSLHIDNHVSTPPSSASLKVVNCKNGIFFMSFFASALKIANVKKLAEQKSKQNLNTI